MIEINIPGYRTLNLKYLVLDYNGTLAVDGILEDGVKELLNRISKEMKIYVVTADTFGKAKDGLSGIECKLSILPKENQDTGKLEFVRRLGSEHVVCMGNGRNDRMMLEEAALGVAVILREGAAFKTLTAADIVCTDIVSALELLLNPLRMTATLRA